MQAYSIDDAATTEIDDAFSVMPRAAGGVRIGIHIAAPALGITMRVDSDGELLAQGNVILKSYWEQPVETAAALEGGCQVPIGACTTSRRIA